MLGVAMVVIAGGLQAAFQCGQKGCGWQVRMGGDKHRGARAQAFEAVPSLVHVRGGCDVGLGQHDHIRMVDLAAAFGIHGDIPWPPARLEGGDEPPHLVALAHDSLLQPLQDGRVIGDPGGLDQHPGEGWDALVQPVEEEALQGGGEILARCAAGAAIVEQKGDIGGGLDEPVVEAHLAQFVDDDHGACEGVFLQPARKKARLSATQKAGQQQNGDALTRSHGNSSRRLRPRYRRSRLR